MLLRTAAALFCLAMSCTAAPAEPPAAPAPTTPQPSAITPSATVDTSPLIHEGIMNAPPAEVWKVFSTPEGFKAFGVAHCDMDFRPGGLIRTHYDPKGVLGDPGNIQNRILAYEPQRVLAMRIDTPPAGFPFMNAYKDTWSVVTLTDLGDGRTLVRFAGMGYTSDPESQKMRAFFQTGNDWSMKKLQSHFDASVKAAPPSQAHADNPLAPIIHSVTVNAPRADVWKSISSGEGWKSFLGVENKIELRPGGPFELYFGSTTPGERGSEGCTVLSYVPERMLSFTWNAPPKFAHARAERTWVVISLEDAGPGKTLVRLEQFGFTEQVAAHPDYADQWKQVRAYFQNAWGRVLGALKDHFEPDAKAE